MVLGAILIIHIFLLFCRPNRVVFRVHLSMLASRCSDNVSVSFLKFISQGGEGEILKLSWFVLGVEVSVDFEVTEALRRGESLGFDERYSWLALATSCGTEFGCVRYLSLLRPRICRNTPE